MTRVLNIDVITTITNAAKLCDVNVFDIDNQQHYKKVDVDFSADRMLKTLKEDKKISEQHEMELTAERLQKDIAALAKYADMYAVQAEERSDWRLVAKSSAMRKSSQDKVVELSLIEKQLLNYQLSNWKCITGESAIVIDIVHISIKQFSCMIFMLLVAF